MGTRATYEVEKQVFYCHWDGYKAGAAVRFANLVAAMTQPSERGIDPVADKRGGAAFAFIRGNADAEPAYRGRHDGHGDTEYRYNIETSDEHGLTVRVEERHWNSGGADWRGFGMAQPLAGFINKHGREFNTPRIVAVSEPSSWGTHAPKLATLDNAREIARLYREKGEGFADGNPNRESYLKRADAWDAAIAADHSETVAA